jgi:Leucine-rich repeat (LRR) protein
MTTVGYGDFFPSTIFGRLIIIFACISGVFLISMLGLLESTNGQTIDWNKFISNNNETLDAAYKNITSLKGLEKFEKLTRIYISLNSLVDLSPLRNLTNLIYLQLSFNRILDLSALSNLTNLIHLDLDSIGKKKFLSMYWSYE